MANYSTSSTNQYDCFDFTPIAKCLEILLLAVANETVEKLLFQSTFPGSQLLDRSEPRFEDAKTDGFPSRGSVERPERLDLADMVDQGEPRTRPLYIHFQLGLADG
jgi:hypothetical protein